MKVLTNCIIALCLVVIIFLSGNKDVKAQTPVFTKLWEQQYGGDARDGSDRPQTMIRYNDSTYYIFCGTTSMYGGNKTDATCIDSNNYLGDGWVIKTDQDGNKMWDHTYGGYVSDGISYCIKTNDGNLLWGGGSNSDSSCEKSQNVYGSGLSGDFWIIKTDIAGNKIWDKRYGWNSYDVLRGMIQTPDKGYLLGGWTWSNTGGDISDTSHGLGEIWLIKIDSVGTKQWDNLIGSSSHDGIFSMTKANNGQYILSGATTGSGPSGDLIFPNYTGVGYYDGWALKVDSMGQITWQGRYGGIGDEDLVDCIEEANGDMLFLSDLDNTSIGGDITDSLIRGGADLWLIKVDSAGNKITDKRIGGNLNDEPCSLQKCADGGYLVLARSPSDQGFEKSEDSKGDYDFWLIKLDTALNIQWDKTIGGPKDEWAPTVIFLNDSTFLLCGQSDSDIGGDKGIASFDTTTNASYQKADMWVTKWMITTPTGIEENNGSSTFNLYPNPASDFIYIRNNAGTAKEKNNIIVIRDISGRELHRQEVSGNSSSHRIGISNLSKGIYFAEWNGKVKRFVKM